LLYNKNNPKEVQLPAATPKGEASFYSLVLLKMIL